MKNNQNVRFSVTKTIRNVFGSALFKAQLMIAISFLGTFLFLEIAVTGYTRWIKKTPLGGVALLSLNAQEIRFDPISGYRMPSQPVGYTRINQGLIEFNVPTTGNAQGFSDRSDFSLKKQKESHRYLVLGDSYSAQYVNHLWPDRVENAFSKRNLSVELMNTSLAATGLANWHSLLTKEFGAKGYELDGIIFAVFEADFDRKFFMRDCDQNHCRSAYWGSWDPKTYPSSIEQAAPFLKEEAYHVVPDVVFAKAVEGDFLGFYPFRLVVWDKLSSVIGSLVRGKTNSVLAPGIPSTDSFSEPQRKLINDMRRVADAKRLPIKVFYVRDRQNLLTKPRPESKRAIQFAELLGAEFFDDEQIFMGMSDAEISQHFYRYDGHWNQKGSDLFSNWVTERLSSAIEEKPLS